MVNLLLTSNNLNLLNCKDYELFCIHSDLKYRITEELGFKDQKINEYFEGSFSREDLELVSKFERSKYDQIIPILSSRLNKIHKMEETDLYWENVMGYSLLIHISNIKRIFDYLDSISTQPLKIAVTQDTPKILSYIPRNESDFRNFYEHSLKGSEQIVNLYFNLFKKNYHGEVFFDINANHNSFSLVKSEVKNSAYGFFNKILKKRKLIINQVLVYLLKILRKPKILVLNVLWSREAIQNFSIQSKGEGVVDFYHCSSESLNNSLNETNRNIFSELPQSSDNFDKLIFSSLKKAAPKSWLEDYKAREKHALRFLRKYNKINNIAVEGQDEDSLLILALTKKQMIETGFIEHNWLQHHLLGNQIWYYLRKVDKYYTLGWKKESETKLYPWGSLFPWTNPTHNPYKDIEILYISTCPHARMAFSTAGDGDKGSYNADTYTEMRSNFMNNLAPSTLKEIYFKDYPKWRKAKFAVHYLDKVFYSNYSNKFNFFDTEGLIDTKDLINRSKIIVVDYLATAYLQALASDVPTIVLHNSNGYELTKENYDFYDELIRVKILHTNATSAAQFLEDIKNDPNSWWFNEEVKDARLRFTKNFLSDSNTLELDLLKLIKK